MTRSPDSSSTVRKASLFYFVFVMFSYTTGGPFGLEAMVIDQRPRHEPDLLLVIPFFLSIPVSLVTAELTTAMPVEGGFYRWTRAAFGDFWGFLSGWWNWTASFLLGGSYAVLFTDYLTYYFPGITGWKHWLGFFRTDRPHHLDQYSWHPDGRQSGHTFRNIYFYSRNRDDRDRPGEVASQSLRAAGSTASAILQSLRSRPGPRHLGILRIRASLNRCRGRRKPAGAPIHARWRW